VRFTSAVLFSLITVVAQGPPPPRLPPPLQAGPPRDIVPRPEPTGTGIIRGRVVAADTGSPIRRANVMLFPAMPPPPPPPPPGTPAGTTTTVTTTMTMTMSSSGVPVQIGSGFAVRPRTVTTDAQGAFEFTGLPAGRYRLTATAGQYSAAYLGIAYGAKRPNAPGSQDPGQQIELTNGQTFDKAVIGLPRGGVITGRVTDENGEALARVQVYTVFFQPGNPRGQRQGNSGQTDDLGQFRLYGLTPGEYAVVAEARGPTFVQPNAPPETEEDKIGFLTTYYPGTPDEGAAQRVRARAGGETPAIEIRMASGRLFRISGTITDSQGRVSNRTSGSLLRRQGTSTSNFGFSTDDQGRFQMRNIPPGNYRLIVRTRPIQVPDGVSTQNEPGEMANMALAVSTDLENVAVVTAPGATITGQIVFEQGPPPQLPQQMRINASVVDPENNMGMPGPQPALVGPDLTFTMKGMMGEFVLRAGAQGQFLKAVMMGAEDITDTPREFKTGDRVTLVLTTRASTLEGNVTDAQGKPSTDAGIMFFSDDKASWRMNSSKTRRSGVDQAGHYKLSGLMPGRYLIVAVPRERLSGFFPGVDATLFEQLSKEATSVVVGEDEQRQVDLKVVSEPGGQ
jgi:protocatechuate 3,4-dioxygenase beta subunit